MEWNNDKNHNHLETISRIYVFIKFVKTKKFGTLFFIEEKYTLIV